MYGGAPPERPSPHDHQCKRDDNAELPVRTGPWQIGLVWSNRNHRPDVSPVVRVPFLATALSSVEGTARTTTITAFEGWWQPQRMASAADGHAKNPTIIR